MDSQPHFLGDFMQRYSNVIKALVYAGAAFLVVIVGLRGLGDMSTIGIVPKWLLEESTGRISVNIVMFGLVAEFAILLAFALLAFNAPKDLPIVAESKMFSAATIARTDIAKLVDAERQIIEALGRKMETLIESERRIIEQIGNKYNEVAEAQRHILELLSQRVSETHINNDEVVKRIDTNVDFLKNAHLVRRRQVPDGSPTLS
jgi:hypothetical protein